MAPRPGIVLLDLNLPGTDGREVLRIVKADPDLKLVPVIVLTISDAIEDIESCYAAGASTCPTAETLLIRKDGDDVL